MSRDSGVTSSLTALSPLEIPLTVPAAHTKRHARDMADRQPIDGANLLAALELGIVIVALAAALVLTNRDEMPQGLQGFLSMRVTLRNALLLTTLVLGWKLVFRMFGLYSVGGLRSVSTERVRVVLACTVASLLALGVSELTLGRGLRPLGV